MTKAQDQVTFAMMNVFGRTMQAKDVANGRQHNDGQHVTLMVGAGTLAATVGLPAVTIEANFVNGKVIQAALAG